MWTKQLDHRTCEYSDPSHLKSLKGSITIKFILRVLKPSLKVEKDFDYGNLSISSETIRSVDKDYYDD